MTVTKRADKYGSWYSVSFTLMLTQVRYLFFAFQHEFVVEFAVIYEFYPICSSSLFSVDALLFKRSRQGSKVRSM